MKRKIAACLSAILLVCSAAGCGSGGGQAGTLTDDQPEASGVEAGEDGTVISDDRLSGLMEAYQDIEPLEEAVTIRYLGTIGLQLSAPLWVAHASGALEEAGVTIDFTPASTGPLSIEALTAGETDLVGTGIGGIAVGTIQGVARVLCYINNEAAGQKFFVKPDSDLAQAEFNEETGFYGNAEDWKGKEVYMPSGTTLQYLMGVSMKKLDLTLQDVTPVYMDANNVNTAMYAKKGEVWGIWNYLCYAAALKEEGFVPVIEGDKVGIHLVTAFMTNENVWADPKKRAGIEKILEYHFATLKWMQENDENMQLAAEIMQQWCEEEGSAVTYDEMYAYLAETDYYDYDENCGLLTSKVENSYGTMIEAMDVLQGIMDFYIEQGNYTEEDRAAMIRNQDALFNMDALNALP